MPDEHTLCYLYLINGYSTLIYGRLYKLVFNVTIVR